MLISIGVIIMVLHILKNIFNFVYPGSYFVELLLFCKKLHLSLDYRKSYYILQCIVQ